MKKLVLMFVAVAAISFASCGNKAAEEPVVEDSVVVADTDTIAADTTDSVAADTTVAE